jgi:hypothetical protein
MSVNQVNVGGILKADDSYLAKAQTIPNNTSADGNGGSFQGLNATLGGVEVVVEVNTQIALADTKVLTVKLQDSADNSSFADLVTLYTKTASGAETIAAGTVLKKYIVPTNARKYIKAVITTTDTGQTGKIDAFLNYLAR